MPTGASSGRTCSSSLKRTDAIAQRPRLTKKNRRARLQERRQLSDRRVVATRATFSTGPIPSPDFLEQYDRIEPGAAHRILQQWEQQSAHRQALETRALDANIRAEGRGQWMALVLATLVFALAGLLIWNGKSLQGLGLTVSMVALLTYVFMKGRNVQGRELGQKTSALSAQQELPFELPANTSDDR
jgi:uncharacterized membrane protein